MPRDKKSECCICDTKTTGRWYKTDHWQHLITGCFLLKETRIGLLCSGCKNNVVNYEKNGITYGDKVGSKGKSGVHSNVLRVKQGKDLHSVEIKSASSGNKKCNKIVTQCQQSTTATYVKKLENALEKVFSLVLPSKYLKRIKFRVYLISRNLIRAKYFDIEESRN